MYHILICDDEQDIVNVLKIYLMNPDFKLFEANTGVQALEVMEREDIHLILLDIMMPEMDGISAMVKIREDTDKILGLNTGADDYITKPFNPVEVTARVRSQLRRYMQLGSRAAATARYVIGGVELDDSSKEVTLDGEPISLTPIEYDILKLLMESPGKVYSPKEIYRQVWKEAPLGSDNTVAVHIRHLREKIEINPADPRYLKVVWGQGYKMEKGAKR